MKILHTSDWHLGASIEGKNRIDEQLATINEIAKIADEKNVDVILFAGDAFVNPNMPSYADHLFEKALIKLSNNGNRAIVAISGNNDIPERFVACKELALKQNCFLFNNLNTDFDEENICKDKSIKLTDYGKGFIELSKGDDKIVVALMPYPAFFGNEQNKTREEALVPKIKRLLELGAIGFKEDSFNIILAHFYMKNNTEPTDPYFEIPIEAIPNEADYVALGHVHAECCVDEERHIYYSGGTVSLYYQIHKQKYSVTVFETDGHKIKNNQKIRLTSPKTMLKITANDYTDAVTKLQNTDATYVRLMMKQLKKDEFSKLKKEFSSLTNISMLPARLKKPNKNLQTALNDEKIFVEFFKNEYNKEPSDKLIKCYKDLIKGDK